MIPNPRYQMISASSKASRLGCRRKVVAGNLAMCLRCVIGSEFILWIVRLAAVWADSLPPHPLAHLFFDTLNSEPQTEAD